ncbi:hypothetical protein F441_20056, partial [Phytophthora nicotianae CJ01A1]
RSVEAALASATVLALLQQSQYPFCIAASTSKPSQASRCRPSTHATPSRRSFRSKRPRVTGARGKALPRISATSWPRYEIGCDVMSPNNNPLRPNSKGGRHNAWVKTQPYLIEFLLDNLRDDPALTFRQLADMLAHVTGSWCQP